VTTNANTPYVKCGCGAPINSQPIKGPYDKETKSYPFQHIYHGAYESCCRKCLEKMNCDLPDHRMDGLWKEDNVIPFTIDEFEL